MSNEPFTLDDLRNDYRWMLEVINRELAWRRKANIKQKLEKIAELETFKLKLAQMKDLAKLYLGQAPVSPELRVRIDRAVEAMAALPVQYDIFEDEPPLSEN